MVLQYKKKSATRWKDYPGKDKIEGEPNKYDFRLLNKDKTKTLVEKGNYEKGFTLIELMVVVAIMAILAIAGLSIFTTARQKSQRY